MKTGTNNLEVTRTASLAERQAGERPYDVPQWGKPITPGELLTLILTREGDRNDALELLAMTLADLGITGEEIAHWQNKPGICYDCNDTDELNHKAWESRQFPDQPFDYGDSYYKKDGPSGRRYRA